jgi:hypothetical protein
MLKKTLVTTYQHWVETKSKCVFADQDKGMILAGIEIYKSIVKTPTPNELTMLFASIYSPSGESKSE